ncbi:hypothetical protein D3C73_667170 [compost metagenome]
MTKDAKSRYNNLCLFGVIIMEIQLKELAKKEELVQLTEDLDLKAAFEGRKDILHHSLVHADLHAKHEAGAFKVKGTLTVDVEFSCSRCLTDMKQTVKLPFEEVFTQNPLDQYGQEIDEDVHLVTEDKVELVPYVLEHVVLGLPYTPLCDRACKGLCPECGVNRNLVSCSCSPVKLDPRFAGLADFFNKED